MSEIKWSQMQLEAINSRNSNLLVSAAAGSGKTAVLVERIISLITDPKNPISVDNLLVVTFTNAAAAEMRERISEALEKKLKKNPRSKQLQRQLTLLDKSSISTIHSFCLDVIRRFFYKIELDPAFRIGNEIEVSLLKLDVIEKILEDEYDKEDPSNFIELVEAFGGEKDDSYLQELVLNLYEFSRSNPWPDEWLKEKVELFNSCTDEFDNLIWVSIIKDSINMDLERAENNLKTALKLSKQNLGPSEYVENLEDELLIVNDIRLSLKHKWDNTYALIKDAEFKRLKRCSKDVDDTIKEKVRSLRDESKDIVKKTITLYFSRSKESLVEEIQNLYPILKNLAEIVIKFSHEYEKAKRAKKIVDFGDLEHFCLRILQSPETSQLIKDQFNEILVDEYQDINAVQESILSLIKKDSPPNLFMVGDVKQSIYRFRLARPELFLEKYMAYSEKKGDSSRRIDLSKNFRSRKNILWGINYIFSQIMSEKVGELVYDEKASLIYGLEKEDDNINIDDSIELNLIDSKEKEEDTNDNQEDLDNSQLEARLIGKRIKELTENNKFKYKDIVILLRSTKNWSESFLKEFRQLGIPSYGDIRSGYFDAVEIKTFISLLKIIDNPIQDISLAGVLRSPIVGLDANSLSKIRNINKDHSFYEALLEYSQIGQDLKLKKVCKDFISKLEEWRTVARQGSVADLIWLLYRETGYYDYVGGMPGGNQRQANLRALHDRAYEFEKTVYRGLFRFLRFIENIEEKGDDMGEAPALGENENVVKIMSIHKSKGLQFPVVFIAGLGKKFNLQDLNAKVLFHKDLGLGPDYVDTKLSVKYPTLAKLALRKKLYLETIAEEMRILYVAMTRAKYKLIISGIVKEPKSKLNIRDLPINEGEIASAKTPLEWICLAIFSKNNSPKDLIRWKIKTFDKNDFESEQTTNKIEKFKIKDLEDLKGYEDEIINKCLSWTYPHIKIIGKQAKLTVSELKDSKDFLPQIVKKPEFTQNKKLVSPVEKGNILHAVMRQINLKSILDKKDILNQAENMVKNEIIRQEDLELIDFDKIEVFFNSSLGKRLINAENVKREIPFNMLIPAKEVYPEIASPNYDNEKIMVQGIIDCLFYEENEIVLLDYKTDRIEKDNISIAKIRYSSQISLYTRAVEKILKKKVKDRYLYLFYPEIEVKL